MSQLTNLLAALGVTLACALTAPNMTVAEPQAGAPMTRRAVEIRSYNLKPGRRPEFHRQVSELAVPMLRRWKVARKDLLGRPPVTHVVHKEESGPDRCDTLVATSPTSALWSQRGRGQWPGALVEQARDRLACQERPVLSRLEQGAYVGRQDLPSD